MINVLKKKKMYVKKMKINVMERKKERKMKRSKKTKKENKLKRNKKRK